MEWSGSYCVDHSGLVAWRHRVSTRVEAHAQRRGVAWRHGGVISEAYADLKHENCLAVRWWRLYLHGVQEVLIMSPLNQINALISPIEHLRVRDMLLVPH
jgi:hypothetical protein